MERKGAAFRITQTRPQQTDLQSGGMRPMNPWFAVNDGARHSYTEDEALSLSVDRHPSGGYKASVSNSAWNPRDPDDFEAGPFKTPLRAQVAAESLGERTRDGDPDLTRRYRRR